MTQPSPTTDEVAAGVFSEWLTQARLSLRGDCGAQVPCGDCTGCCTSFYSVQLRPEDARAIAKIPADLLVSPRGFPTGHLTMPARDNGLCPMLIADRCSIYSVRPQTCLDYDCRIFAAAGIDAGGPDKSVINRRVRAWRFTYPTTADTEAHDAVLAASKFIRERKDSFPVRMPSAPMGVAVFAIKAYTVFLNKELNNKTDSEIAREILEAARAFDAESI